MRWHSTAKRGRLEATIKGRGRCGFADQQFGGPLCVVHRGLKAWIAARRAPVGGRSRRKKALAGE